MPFVVGFVFVACAGANAASAAQNSDSVRFVLFHEVKVADEFWAPKLETNRRVTIPHIFKKCEEVGVFDNFAKAAGLTKGGYVDLTNWDNFLYRNVEAAAARYQAAGKLKKTGQDFITIAHYAWPIAASARWPSGYGVTSPSSSQDKVAVMCEFVI
jgi:hypothetical protein